MATFTKFYQYIEDLHKKKHDWSADTFKAMLTNDIPDVTTDAVKADLTDLGTANGYTAGGVTLTSVSAEQTTGLIVVKCAESVITWTASGGNIGPFRSIVIYNDTVASDLLVCCLTFETALTIVSGDTFTRTVNQTTGLYYGS